jgi:hypothetical protein
MADFRCNIDLSRGKSKLCNPAVRQPRDRPEIGCCVCALVRRKRPTQAQMLPSKYKTHSCDVGLLAMRLRTSGSPRAFIRRRGVWSWPRRASTKDLRTFSERSTKVLNVLRRILRRNLRRTLRFTLQICYPAPDRSTATGRFERGWLVRSPGKFGRKLGGQMRPD